LVSPIWVGRADGAGVGAVVGGMDEGLAVGRVDGWQVGDEVGWTDG
jgi:hypothetical protein